MVVQRRYQEECTRTRKNVAKRRTNTDRERDQDEGDIDSERREQRVRGDDMIRE